MSNPELPEQLPGFDEPIALLRACHNKIVAHCELLEQIVKTMQQDDGEFDSRDEGGCPGRTGRTEPTVIT